MSEIVIIQAYKVQWVQFSTRFILKLLELNNFVYMQYILFYTVNFEL